MYVEIDEKAFEALDGDVKKQFKNADKAFTDLEEKVESNREKANELLSEKKKADAKVAKLEADLKEAKLKPGDSDAAKLQAQLDDATAKVEKLEGQLKEASAETSNLMIKAEADRIAAGLTKDTSKASLLAKEIKGRLQYEDGKITVLDENGKATISKPEELAEGFKKSYPFLVDGIDSSGGGAGGGGKGGGAPESKQVTRTEFEAMDQTERSKFSREGGKVVNE